MNNNPSAWGITLAEFDSPSATWGRTLSLDPTTASNSYFYDNLPIEIQRSLLNPEGFLDVTKLEVFFNNKVQEVIDGIVRVRKILNTLDFQMMAESVKGYLRWAVYRAIQFALDNTYSENNTPKSLSAGSLSISDSLSNWVTSSSAQGTSAWNAIMDSKVHLYVQDPNDPNKIIFDGNVVTIRFKTGQEVSETELATSADLSLRTKKQIDEDIAFQVQKVKDEFASITAAGKAEIIDTPNISDIITNYDAYIKANQTTAHDNGVSVDLRYTGTDEPFATVGLIETYTKFSDVWNKVTDRYQTTVYLSDIVSISFENTTKISELTSTKEDKGKAILIDGSSSFNTGYSSLGRPTAPTSRAEQDSLSSSIDGRFASVNQKNIDQDSAITTNASNIASNKHITDDYMAFKPTAALLSDIQGELNITGSVIMPATVATTITIPLTGFDTSSTDKIASLINSKRVDMLFTKTGSPSLTLHDALFNDGTGETQPFNNDSVTVDASPTQIVISNVNGADTTLLTGYSLVRISQNTQAIGASVDATARTAASNAQATASSALSASSTNTASIGTINGQLVALQPKVSATTLPTTSQTIEGALLEVANSLATTAQSSSVGVLANLTTTAKDSLVNAINEVNANKAPKDKEFKDITTGTGQDGYLTRDFEQDFQKDKEARINFGGNSGFNGEQIYCRLSKMGLQLGFSCISQQSGIFIIDTKQIRLPKRLVWLPGQPSASIYPGAVTGITQAPIIKFEIEL